MNEAACLILAQDHKTMTLLFTRVNKNTEAHYSEVSGLLIPLSDRMITMNATCKKTFWL